MLIFYDNVMETGRHLIDEGKCFFEVLSLEKMIYFSVSVFRLRKILNLLPTFSSYLLDHVKYHIFYLSSSLNELK